MGQFDFKLSEGYSIDTLNRVQNRLFEMATLATDVLEQNGFKYSICFGTLLGAVRHRDLIPWDDDFDLFLFDDEYDRAVDCLRENLPEDIVVHDKKTDPTYYAAWTKLRDRYSRTTCLAYPDDDKHPFTGVNIDLYKLTKVRRVDLDAFIEKEHIEFLVRKHDVGFMSDEEFWNKFKRWTCTFASYIRDAKCSQADDYVYAFIDGIKKIEINEMFPLKKYLIRGKEFLGPNDADALLRSAYGADYMTPPAFNERAPHCNSVVFTDR